MDLVISKVKEIIKKRASETDWRFHITPVVNNALRLAQKYKVDKELVILAALLHDIGRMPYSDKKDEFHNITGAIIAEKLLKKIKYPPERTKLICGAIKCHRGSDGIKPKNMLDKIIANADAMSHFDVLPVFFFWRSHTSVQEIIEWVSAKYLRNIRKKLTLPEAKKIVKEKYFLNKKILANLKEISKLKI